VADVGVANRDVRCVLDDKAALATDIDPHRSEMREIREWILDVSRATSVSRRDSRLAEARLINDASARFDRAKRERRWD